MKKNRVLLLLLTIVIGVIAWGLYTNADSMASPWKRTASFDALSEVATDPSNRLYVIGDSKLSLTKMDEEGRMVFRQTSARSADGGLNHYDGIAADSAGNAYVLVTRLDSYGLYVIGEQVVKISPDGRSSRIVVDYQYDDKKPRMLRVGKIKSLIVRGDRLFYYLLDGSTMTLYELNGAGETAQSVFQQTLPADQTLTEAAGIDAGSRFYMTRKGQIFKLMPSGESRLIYPLPGMERTTRNVPQGLQTDGQRIIFMDQLLNEVSRIDPDAPYIVESKLNPGMYRQAGYGALENLQQVLSAPDSSIYVVTETGLIKMDNSGKIVSSLSSYAYPGDMIVRRYVFWLAALIEAALLLLLARFIYIRFLERKLPLLLKFFLAFVPILVISMLWLSDTIYRNLSDKLELEIRQNLALLASNGKTVVDGDRLERLASPTDYMNDDYRAIRDRLSSLYNKDKGAGREGLYTTLYKVENGKLFILMDDDDSVAMFTPYPIDEDNRLVMEKGQILTGKSDDSSGSWLYAIGPIYNSAGAVVGIYETGKDFNGVKEHNQETMLRIIWYMVILTSVLLIVFLAIALTVSLSVRRLRDSVNEIASGRWDVSVDIRSRDELADLGDRFNMMALHIRNYFKEITQFSEAYFRFVPQQFLKFLGKESIVSVQLGDQVQQNMSILVSNMRDFYRFSRKLTPFENFNFINSYLKRFGPVIRKHEGFVSKYLGAGFLTLFAGGADQALRAAVQMRATLDEYNGHRANVNYNPLDMGIAIHHGPIMLGVIGEEKRMEGSVISEHVSLASELETMTAQLGVSILITDEAYRELSNPGAYMLRSLGLVLPYGEEQAFRLYDVYQGDPEEIRKLKHETRAAFETAIEWYQNGRFYDAREAFVQIIKINRFDQAARLYFYLCDEYFQNGAPSDWNGTLTLS